MSLQIKALRGEQAMKKCILRGPKGVARLCLGTIVRQEVGSRSISDHHPGGKSVSMMKSLGRGMPGITERLTFRCLAILQLEVLTELMLSGTCRNMVPGSEGRLRHDTEWVCVRLCPLATWEAACSAQVG